MVEVCIWIEGGVLPNDNHSAQTMDNSLRLRQSFSKFFSTAFESEQLKIIVEKGGANKSTIKFFKNSLEKNQSALLLIDLDGPKETKKSTLDTFELTQFEEKVFFMVQSLEAWFLSQPNIIEQHFLKFKIGDIDVSQDNLILNKNPESISKPDDVLNTILSRYFRENRKGKTKKLKYTGGKMKIAPNLIELLDFQALKLQFEDVRNLHQTLLEWTAND